MNAGNKDVLVLGADVARQLLRADLLDEIRIHLVPLLLGEGTPLVDGQRAELIPDGKPITGTVTLPSFGLQGADHVSLGRGAMLSEAALLAASGVSAAQRPDSLIPLPLPSAVAIKLVPGTTAVQRQQLVNRIVSANPDQTPGGTQQLRHYMAAAVVKHSHKLLREGHFQAARGSAGRHYLPGRSFSPLRLGNDAAVDVAHALHANPPPLNTGAYGGYGGHDVIGCARWRREQSGRDEEIDRRRPP